MAIAVGAVLVLDLAARYSFWEPLYGIGPVVLKKTMPDLATPIVALGTVSESKHGVFKLAAADRLLARERFYWFDRYQAGVVVTIDWSTGVAEATARMSAGLLAMLGVFTFFALLWSADWVSTVIGVAVVAVLIIFYALLSKSRSERLIREYLEGATHA